jgi:hypothetical protein
MDFLGAEGFRQYLTELFFIPDHPFDQATNRDPSNRQFLHIPGFVAHCGTLLTASFHGFQLNVRLQAFAFTGSHKHHGPCIREIAFTPHVDIH